MIAYLLCLHPSLAQYGTRLALTHSCFWNTAMKEDPVFPQELFDLVIDFTDDTETLRSCALVSSSFYTSAHLFSCLRVGPLDEEHNIDKLHELLERSPSLAARVKSLHLWDNVLERGGLWMDNADSARFLALLPSLTRLSITCLGGFQWTTISGALRDSIQLTLAQSAFTCLELAQVSNLKLTLLSRCPALRSLTLRWVTFDTTENFDSAIHRCAGSQPARLEHLVLKVRAEALGMIARWILSPKSSLDISRLQSLECSVHDFLPIQRLVDEARGLQRLRLLDYDNVQDTHTLDLHEHPQLHTLSLSMWVPSVDGPHWQRLLSLGNVVFTPRQQTLTLLLDVTTEAVREGLVRLFVGTDSALAALPFLTNVTVNFLIWEPEDGRGYKLVDVSDEFVREMPLLANSLQGRGAFRALESITLNTHHKHTIS
ncbi:hypothetical protein K438DRAFT_2029534 [Mycena galopus ATCC 62051]|nr:hypothetical protein K438DRAFT_2029534 [Mycena galopus ATCC 62051]